MLILFLPGCVTTSTTSTIFTTIYSGDVERLQNLLAENEIDINVTNESGNSMLHEATRKGNLEIINLLIENGADVNALDAWGESPLHIAAQKDLDIVQNLIQNGADIHAKSNSNLIPENNGDGMFDELWRKADQYMDEINRHYLGATALHFAATSKQVDIAEYLISLGSDINARSTIGNTPLHAAYFIAEGNEPMIEFLLAQGVDPIVRNDDGQNASEAGVRYVETYNALVVACDAINLAASSVISTSNAQIISNTQKASLSSSSATSRKTPPQNLSIQNQQINIYRANDRYRPYGDPSNPGIR